MAISERRLFDALHDMGDPVGAASQVRQSLHPDGTFMIVEPNAGDSLAENIRSAESTTGSRRWYAPLLRSARKLALPLERRLASGG
jgi:hypothetical protein